METSSESAAAESRPDNAEAEAAAPEASDPGAEIHPATSDPVEAQLEVEASGQEAPLAGPEPLQPQTEVEASGQEALPAVAEPLQAQSSAASLQPDSLQPHSPSPFEPTDSPALHQAPVGWASPALQTEAAPEVPVGIADGQPRALDPRTVEVERTVGWIITAVLSGGALIGLLLWIVLSSVPSWKAWTSAGGWLALSGLLAWWLHRWPAVEYRHASYRLDGQGIEIRRGIYWRSIVHVPRSRVQHTDVSQGPLQSSYGLGTLMIYTAGTEHAQIELDGLDHALALQIRDQLLPRESNDAV